MFFLINSKDVPSKTMICLKVIEKPQFIYFYTRKYAIIQY
jgi:hypothetical protein